MEKVRKTDEEWAQILSEEQFRICRKKGTERAFTGQYHDCKTPGRYCCSCCAAPLFNSDSKFDSGTGWPSFSEPVGPQCLDEAEDYSFSTHRIEVRCRACDAHLGHVFNDGPEPGRLRYCINSVSLKLDAADDQ